ncbi:MAG: hypothetical protein HZB67_04425 [Candidatus Aenigmarchaeota archaeon]|nr:hypothetical protein [Candidatus Aenigmarchaeota archaeon]
MNILWLSANRFGYELLKEAVKITNDVKAIITLSDDARTMMYDGISKEKWREFGIDVHEVSVLNEESTLIESFSPDLIVVCGWRQIISKEILSIPKHGVVGFHPTMLPKGRGTNHQQGDIVNSETWRCRLPSDDAAEGPRTGSDNKFHSQRFHCVWRHDVLPLGGLGRW